VWVAFRFSPRETATAILVLAGIATWGTLHGYGPFVGGSFNESLLLLQAYMMITSVTTLALAALVSERRQVEGRLRQLAVSDPLTGLANNRQLAFAIDAEIKRSQRTERAFTLVLLDLDSLKQINDRYGHSVGSLALCRVAEALFGSCRGVDTAARYGGDEFALVLPDTGGEGAFAVGERIRERIAAHKFLAGEGLDIHLTGSVGVATLPDVAASSDELVSAADKAMYAVKESGKNGIQAAVAPADN
jgi:diguanylate cyclase (GGDEF)-like protein